MKQWSKLSRTLIPITKAHSPLTCASTCMTSSATCNMISGKKICESSGVAVRRNENEAWWHETRKMRFQTNTSKRTELMTSWDQLDYINWANVARVAASTLPQEWWRWWLILTFTSTSTEIHQDIIKSTRETSPYACLNLALKKSIVAQRQFLNGFPSWSSNSKISICYSN